MTRDKMQDLEDFIVLNKQTQLGLAFRDFLLLRREVHRDKLEGANNDEIRGRAKECKDILNILVDN